MDAAAPMATPVKPIKHIVAAANQIFSLMQKDSTCY
ncbi:hypothetical protein HCH_04134 [Hahella chejuensis KCTC 2396]|uniref:Uncharacterized protein n=1 Tax=Hahella chejuensis (strain KCTC 2396) TaxID=349521 RepID=Q2SET0_HAHCH|nr:hypothetical protein HCH_04134 [Hahella chejuensis KCTC 2396]